MRALAAIGVALAAGAAAACKSPAPDAYLAIPAPSRESFVPADGGIGSPPDTLGSHCGSLDCHGAVERNLRVYSYNGLRIDGVSGNNVTTAAEYEATYEAVVGFDPEMLDAVVQDHGARPERWIIVRKGRGTEHHVGGAALSPLIAQVCLTSWLVGTPNPEACAQSAEVLPPEPP